MGGVKGLFYNVIEECIHTTVIFSSALSPLVQPRDLSIDAPSLQKRQFMHLTALLP